MNAGVALYGQTGHQIDLVSFGDVGWKDVPEENRSEMDCGGYEQGSVTRAGAFAVSEFPYYLELWYGEIRPSRLEQRTPLQYSGDVPPNQRVEPSEWETVGQTEGRQFPPLPDVSQDIDDGVKMAKLVSFSQDCRKQELRVTDTYCCDIGIVESIHPSTAEYVLGLTQAMFTEDGTRVQIEVVVRDFQRPPAKRCEPSYLSYIAGLSFTETPPTEFEVVNRNVDGNEMSREVLTR